MRQLDAGHRPLGVDEPGDPGQRLDVFVAPDAEVAVGDPPVCGDGTVTAPEQCDPPGSLTCPSGVACAADCTCPPPPEDATAPAIPCESKTAHVAYILMAERNDTNGDSHNNGKYTMYLTVNQPAQGGPNAIKPGENLNPVKTLRMRYDAWRKLQPASFK